MANEQTWAASVLNMSAKEFSRKWTSKLKRYVAPGVTTEEGSKEANQLKFRYADVPCIDQTRVILKDRQANADFIHGNWLGPAAPGGIKYICTQGPLAETTADFWHMVYSEGVKVIVMLTQWTSHYSGMEMCAHYFPQNVGESMVAGAYKVTCAKMLDGPAVEQCVYRQFSITCGDKTREVVHAHAGYWPNNCAPAATAPTLALRRWAHEQHDGQPVVVHGSAGVGASLTFCAIDFAIARIAADPTTDFCKLTKELRAMRAYAFQSHVHVLYLFCLTLDALVADKKIEPYGNSAFVAEYRKHTQRRHERALALKAQKERDAEAALGPPIDYLYDTNGVI